MTQLTQEDKQEIINGLLSSLSTSCRKIEQLTMVHSLDDTNEFEIGGGKKVSFATIKTVIASIVSESIRTIKPDLKQDIESLIGKANGIAPLDSNKIVPYSNLPYICVRFDKFVTMPVSKAISSDESFVPSSDSIVAYNSVTRGFVLTRDAGDYYYRAWKGMRSWGYFNGNCATPHHGILYWDGSQLYTYDNSLGLQEVIAGANSGSIQVPETAKLMTKAEAVTLVEKEFSSPLNLNGYE